jgi:hypothetical protein
MTGVAIASLKRDCYGFGKTIPSLALATPKARFTCSSSRSMIGNSRLIHLSSLGAAAWAGNAEIETSRSTDSKRERT